MVLIDKLRKLIDSELTDTSYFVVDIIGNDRSRKVQILLDGDEGVTVETCRKVSRQLSQTIDEDEFEAEPFILEVSSPGVDTPLTLARQYTKHKGRVLDVTKTDETILTARLHSSDNEQIVVEQEVKSKNKAKKPTYKEPVEIPFSEIKHSIVKISFK